MRLPTRLRYNFSLRNSVGLYVVKSVISMLAILSKLSIIIFENGNNKRIKMIVAINGCMRCNLSSSRWLDRGLLISRVSDNKRLRSGA